MFGFTGIGMTNTVAWPASARPLSTRPALLSFAHKFKYENRRRLESLGIITITFFRSFPLPFLLADRLRIQFIFGWKRSLDKSEKLNPKLDIFIALASLFPVNVNTKSCFCCRIVSFGKATNLRVARRRAAEIIFSIKLTDCEKKSSPYD